ncbi:hypothetical protein AB0M87_07830 [Streptomyces sp. NPDC051320]|uniref:hypothetical protein n=1 Tax=Streptomyces sp. NPDC051320 TaxID=3154644 RepID=UPI00343B8766
MSGAVTAAGADRAARTVLAARTYPGAAVLVVALRGGHWPYSCGLASTVRRLAPLLSAAGAEVLLLGAGTPQERETTAAVWRLPFRWLPEAAGEPVARELGVWDEASGRILDGLGLLGPDGDWILCEDLDDPGGTGSPEAVLAALRGARLVPVPVPAPAPLSDPTGSVHVPLGGAVASTAGVPVPSRTAGAVSAWAPASGDPADSLWAGPTASAGPAAPPRDDSALRLSAGAETAPSADRAADAADTSAAVRLRTGVRDPAHVAGFLRRALAGADRLARDLPSSSPAAVTAGRTRLRLARYLRAVQDLVPSDGTS